MPARLHPLDSSGVVKVDKPIIFVGRHPECDLVITNSRKVSRKHCCLAEVNGQFMVRDLGSTNGVQVNGNMISKTKKIESGDEIIFGDVAYRFESAQVSAKSTGDPLESPTKAPPVSYEPDHDVSSEIPVMIDEEPMNDEQEGDGFEVFNEPQKRRSSQRKKKGSGSVPEFVID